MKLSILTSQLQFEGGVRRGMSAAGVAIPLAVGVGALVLALQLQGLAGANKAGMSKQNVPPNPFAARPAEIPNFAAHLPADPDPRYFISHLQQRCNSDAVILESLSTWQAAATPKVLGRVGFSVDIKGGYPQLKAVIADAMERNPNLVIQSLSFKRRAEPSVVQAHVEFVALVRPEAQSTTSAGANASSGSPSAAVAKALRPS